MPVISLIAAIDRNRGMGINNQLPWHLPADFAYFKSKTLGKPIIMGRKTFESIGRPLPHRQNIVLTRQLEYQREGVTVVSSLDEAFALTIDANEVMVLGGSEVFKLALEKADNVYLTEVQTEIEADVFFPKLDETRWKKTLISEHAADLKNAYHLKFYRYY